MAIMIEVLNKQHKVLERHKFTNSRVALGRAFDNDLILFDKHVSPHHAELVLDENGLWHLRDMASLNGSFVEPGKAIDSMIAIESGQLCWLGEQALRLYDENHPVAPAQPYNTVEQRLTKFGHWAAVSSLIAMVLLIEIFSMWLEVPKEAQNEWPRQLIGLPLMLFALALWPSVLAIWARINQHEPRFWAQVGITFACVVLINLADAFFSVVNFSVNGLNLMSWLHESVQWLLIVLMLSANFYLALQISTIRKVLVATAVAFVVVLQSLDSGFFSNEFRRMAPQYDASLMPLSFYFNQPVTQTKFEQGNVELFELVDEHAREEAAEQ